MYLFDFIINLVVSINYKVINMLLNLCWFLNRFRIDDILYEKYYKILVSLKVCYGIGFCVLDIIVLI